MSKHLEIKDLDIVWANREVTLNVGGIAVDFGSESAVFRYSEAPLCDFMMYQFEGRWKRTFLTPEAADSITDIARQIGATVVLGAHPSSEILEQWWDIEMEDLDEELEYYTEKGTFPEYGT